jgi:hypothetical protein
MKNFAVFFGFFFFTAGTLLAQQPTTTVQMQCREFSSTSSVLGPDETLVDGLACHTVKQVASANSQAPAAVPNPASTSVNGQSVVTPAAVVPATPASMKIVPGARVYIAPMDGFENYLAAAFGKKKVQLVPVADQNLADYVISGTSVDKKAGWAKIAFMGNIHSDNAASITMTDRRTGAIVYAYAVDKKSTMHGQQTTAEACAKHLEAHIEGHD